MANYPISNVPRRVVYTGSAGVGPYAFSFEIINSGDVDVYKNDALLTLTTNYTVTINSNGTGSILLGSAATSSDRITIVGARSIERTTDFVTGGDLFANTLNQEIDSQTIFVQQVAETAERSIKAPVTDPTSINMTLPSQLSRANKTLAFDANGNPVVGEDIGNWRGDWTTGTSYGIRDLVKDPVSMSVYRCNTAHVSTGSAPISSNVDSAKFDLVIDGTAPAVAADWAKKTNGIVESTDYSSKAWAIGGTGVTNTSSRGAAKEWAVKTSGTVDGADYSAKYYSQAATSSATSASTSASNAATSASGASTSATNASNSASSASTSATNASNSATSASTSASSASTSATAASGSASSASTSASNASSSASAALTSETNAATSATNAANSQSTASTAATNASNSASAASTSATNASNSASAASTSATNASNSASAAATSETNAATSATNAASSATSASNSATSASNSAAAAAAAIASGLYSAVQDKSANYTLTSSDDGDLIRVTTTSGTITITLPLISTVPDGYKSAIVKWTGDANTVSIAPSGSDTINGSVSPSNINSQYSQLIFVADLQSNQWFVNVSGLLTSSANLDTFSGNNSTTAFTLSSDPLVINNTYVYINGVYQQKSTYSISGTTLTFSTAPPTGTNNVEVVYTVPVAIGVPTDSSITTPKIINGAVTPAKLSTGYPFWNSSGYLGILNTNPQKELHVTSTALTGAAMRFENTNTSMASGNNYGQIEWFGNDNSTNANGVRARIAALAANTTGQTNVVVSVTGSSSTTLTNVGTFSSAGLNVNGTTATNALSVSTGGAYYSSTSLITHGTCTRYAATVNQTNVDSQTDIDFNSIGLVSPDINSHFMVKVSVSSQYINDTGTPVYASSARLFKEWSQSISWNGSAYVINGAALIGTGYTSDATNFTLGAVNAGKVLLVVSGTTLLLRLINRTTPAANSATSHSFIIEVLKNS